MKSHYIPQLQFAGKPWNNQFDQPIELIHQITIVIYVTAVANELNNGRGIVEFVVHFRDDCWWMQFMPSF